MGKAGTSGTVSHCHESHTDWSSSMPGNMMIREREREKEKERKRGVSNSSHQGTPQRKRNCLLHCQSMAIPASSPLNIKHKHNVHTSFFYNWATSPRMGICGNDNRHNYTPSYLHVALSDNNYKACYKQKTDKRETEHRNY